jgi:ankyrin repeat protein
VNLASYEGPPLFFARSAEMVNMLVDAGADVNYQLINKMTSLLMAAKNGNVGVIRALINRNADVSHRGPQRATVLTAALSRTDSVDAVKALLESPAVRALVNKRSHSSGTPLGMAASGSGGDSADIVRALVDAKADVNTDASHGEYPITLTECPQVARALLEANADCNQKARDGGTALSRACVSENTDLVVVLLEHRADMRAATVNGYHYPVLYHAVTADNAGVVELLLRDSSPTMLNCLSADGLTALHVAVQQNRLDIVNMLLNAGADPNIVKIKRGFGKSPLMLCTNIDIAKELLAKGADPRLANKRGEDALMAARRRGDGEMVQLLLAKRADVNAVNQKKRKRNE